MIKLDNIKMPLDHSREDLYEKVCNILKKEPEEWYIYKKAVDARKKTDICFVYSVVIKVPKEDILIRRLENAKIFTEEVFNYPTLKKKLDKRPVVIGSGPAGTFAALCLAKAGARPLIIERGKKVSQRTKDVDNFFLGGKLNSNSNVQFGEGGAGTFSDGKLNTGTSSPYLRNVLNEYVNMGAPCEIKIDAKPHIGTDILKVVAENFRKEIASCGGEYLFESKVSEIEIKDGRIEAVYAPDKIEVSGVILAIGHSARDTFSMLKSHGVNIIQKPFSVGLRIEHPQSLINKAQFGKMANHPALPAADYKLSDECYTFCMCPGGYVVAAASEEDKIVTNGMSFSGRDGENANSALLVNVGAEDFGSEDALAGVWFQQDIESKAFKISESYKAPCQKLSDFLEGKPSQKAGEVMPTYEPGVVFSDVRKCLPYKVTEKLKRGIYNMDKHLSGFAMPDALLTAPETRSSSPVRIVRDKDTCMSNIKGLFPCGEGAGYAGGIMSAAADGIRCAVKMIELFNRGDIDE